jgi:hypothetical protein
VALHHYSQLSKLCLRVGWDETRLAKLQTKYDAIAAAIDKTANLD